MAEITALSPTRRDAERLNVKVDGKFVTVLTRKAVERLDLTVGTEWTDQLAETVIAAGAVEKAVRDGLRRVNRRPTSRRRLADKLRKKEHPADAIEKALDKLEEIGALDDEAFGRALIEEWSRSKPVGPRMIRSKLRQRGLSPQLADRLSDEHAPSTAEQYDTALEFARRKAEAMHRDDPGRRYRRLQGMLARRGFDAEVVREVLEEVMPDTDPFAD
ncbi:MAG: regulatory protein RecX [Phycisphaeraceae bacterium]|nr:regulatory protein RecX [Phycisphaeraceae bacterium]